MGYTTWFEGELTPNKPFKKEFVNYINAFSKKRHEPRDVEIIKHSDPDWAKHCLDGNLGLYGMYYVGGFDEEIIDRSAAKGYTCPGYWCDWHINEKTGVVEWNGAEKFYEYTDWLIFLIENFFEPAGYILNGEFIWIGEDSEDRGKISVVNNKVSEFLGEIVYEDEREDPIKVLKKVSDKDLLDEVIRRGIIL